MDMRAHIQHVSTALKPTTAVQLCGKACFAAPELLAPRVEPLASLLPSPYEPPVDASLAAAAQLRAVAGMIPAVLSDSPLPGPSLAPLAGRPPDEHAARSRWLHALAAGSPAAVASAPPPQSCSPAAAS
eukprot:scaffold12823_cov19-Tisochrysis_lutea.AAC.2